MSADTGLLEAAADFQSGVGQSVLPAGHGADQRGHTFGAGVGLDAMAQVEDMSGTIAHRLEQALGLVANHCGRRVEQRRVQVALQGHVDILGAQRRILPQGVMHRSQVDGPVNAENAGATGGLRGQIPRSPFGVQDHRKIRRQGGNDAADPLQRSRLVVRAGNQTAPRVKDLDGVGAGLDLQLEILDQRDGELFEQGVEKPAVGDK